MRHPARTPEATLASMIVAALLAVFQLVAPPSVNAQTASVTQPPPAVDGERALLGRVVGVPSPALVTDESSPETDGARALLGSTASSGATRTSSAGGRSKEDT